MKHHITKYTDVGASHALQGQKFFLSSTHQFWELFYRIGSLSSISGLPDFSWYNKPKWEKYTKMATKITFGHSIHQNGTKIPNDHEIHQSFPSKALQKCPNWHFLYENIPSGNPAPYWNNNYAHYQSNNQVCSLNCFA
jgi:hypothetical protein